jgi:hypothetical protein
MLSVSDERVEARDAHVGARRDASHVLPRGGPAKREDAREPRAHGAVSASTSSPIDTTQRINAPAHEYRPSDWRLPAAPYNAE